MPRRSKRAQAGIGAMILFIAMILVAAIAAAVIISSATSLQSKALSTGNAARSQISTSVVAISMYGKDAQTTNTLNRGYVKVKLGPGSDAIKFDEAGMLIDTDGGSGTTTYRSTINCSLDSNAANGILNNTANPNNATYYGADWLIGPSVQGYLSRGDVVELCFALPEPLEESERLRISFNPKTGSGFVVETRAPETMLDQRVQLFP